MSQSPKNPKSWTPGSRASGLEVLRQPSLYLHLLWGGSLLIPFVVGSGAVLTGAGRWVMLPLLLNLGLVVASARNLPFPDLSGQRTGNQLSRLLVGALLFAVTFFEQVNTTRANYRPYWSNAVIWVMLILLIFSWQLQEFTLAVVALVSGLMSFMALLF